MKLLNHNIDETMNLYTSELNEFDEKFHIIHEVAIRLNNQGIFMLQQDKIRDAQLNFRRALLYIREYMIKADQRTETVSKYRLTNDAMMENQPYHRIEHSSGYHKNGQLSTSKSRTSLSIKPTSVRHIEKNCKDLSSSIILYDRVLLVNGIYDMTTELDLGFLGSVVAYNIAIASHITDGKSSNSRLHTKSLKLYEVALKMILEYMEENNSNGFELTKNSEIIEIDTDAILLLMAISNNMAYILSMCQSFDELNESLYHFRHIVSSAMERYDMCQFLESYEFMTFYINGISIRNVTFAA